MYVYAKYCPIAAATSVLGNYWTPLIVRELLYGTNRFNQLARNLPTISRSLLASRLRDLERAGVIERIQSGNNVSSYGLTDAGRALAPVIGAMGTWGMRFVTPDPDPAELDPPMVLCMLKDRIRTGELPNRRAVIEVVAEGPRETRGWIVCDRGDVSMCIEPPGFDVDVWVWADIRVLYQVWLQQTTMTKAVSGGAVRVQGTPAAQRELLRWFDGAHRTIPAPVRRRQPNGSEAANVTDALRF